MVHLQQLFLYKCEAGGTKIVMDQTSVSAFEIHVMYILLINFKFIAYSFRFLGCIFLNLTNLFVSS